MRNYGSLKGIAGTAILAFLPARRSERAFKIACKALNGQTPGAADNPGKSDALGGLQQKLHFDRVVREHDATLGPLRDPGIQQCLDVSVDGFHVPAHPSGRFTDRHRPGAAKHFQEFPAFAGQHFPQQFRSREGNSCVFLRYARFPRTGKVLPGFGRRPAVKGHGFSASNCSGVLNTYRCSVGARSTHADSAKQGRDRLVVKFDVDGIFTGTNW